MGTGWQYRHYINLHKGTILPYSFLLFRLGGLDPLEVRPGRAGPRGRGGEGPRLTPPLRTGRRRSTSPSTAGTGCCGC